MVMKVGNKSSYGPDYQRFTVTNMKSNEALDAKSYFSGALRFKLNFNDMVSLVRAIPRYRTARFQDYARTKEVRDIVLNYLWVFNDNFRNLRQTKLKFKTACILDGREEGCPEDFDRENITFIGVTIELWFYEARDLTLARLTIPDAEVILFR
jgi:hypothetical protein